jgi:hypothetical protein
MRDAPIRAIVLLLLLAAACAQCVAQCADAGHGVPPCHRQQQTKTPTLCQIAAVAAKDTPAQLPVEIVAGLAPVLAEVHEFTLHENSVPESRPPLLSSVLRI